MIKRKKTASILIPVASMGDIAFLLIIFFMLASNFMKTANVVVDEAQSEDLEVQEPPLVSVVLDRDGTLWLQGVETSTAQLAAGIGALIGDDAKHPVHVKIDKNRRKADFLPVIEAVSEAGARILLAGAEPPQGDRQ